ncbi:MAG TPA: MFS transporter [Steroidobacteraceae bacterium]|nr:MFS transporter [Steroidobacteraceae bacterium]
MPGHDAGGAVAQAHARPIGLVVMLSLALMINYIDRGSIATAAPLLVDELALTPGEMGWVLAVFYWAYAPMQPVMGWFADRTGPAIVLAGGLALWSVATAATGFAFGLASLIVLRLLMGVGEAAFYPSALSLLARNVPPTQRARATATMQFGAVIGPALGTLVGGVIMQTYGWRAMFLVMGLLSLTWLAFWRRRLRADRVQPGSHRASGVAMTEQPSTGDPPYWMILRQRALWGGMLGTFCSNYAFYFVFSWLPLYLFTERGLSITTMTLATTAFYVADATSILLAGYLLDTWIKRGASFNRAYKTALVLSAGGVGLCLLGSTMVTGVLAAFALLLLTGVMDGFNSPSNPSVTQTFAGPLATGRWMGLQNAVGNVAGMTAPVVTGYLVQQSGHYTSSMIVAGCVALGGVIAWLVVVPEVRPIDWGAELVRPGRGARHG